MTMARVLRTAAITAAVAAVALALLRAIPFDIGLLMAGLSLGALAVGEWIHASRHRGEIERFAREHAWEHVPRTAAYSLRFSGFPFDLPGRAHQSDVLRGTYGGLRCATFTHVVEAPEPRGEAVGWFAAGLFAGASDGYPWGRDRPFSSRWGPTGASAGARAGAGAQTFQVTLAELPVALPRIDIVPESLYHRVAQSLGGMDIEVESHDFNSRWRVRAADRRYGHDVVDPRMIARLLEPDVQGMAIRIDGAAVMVWQVGRQGPSSLARRLGVVAGIARRIPAHVVRAYTEAGHAVRDPNAPLVGPDWAVTPGALTSRRYTGIGVDADGDGVEDWRRRGALGRDVEPH